MVDTVIVNSLTDTLSVSVSKCEMALDTIDYYENIENSYSTLKKIFATLLI